MKIIASTAFAAALALSACADMPQGPPLTYEGLLPNTHENPVWARDHWPPAPAPVAAPAR